MSGTCKTCKVTVLKWRVRGSRLEDEDADWEVSSCGVIVTIVLVDGNLITEAAAATFRPSDADPVQTDDKDKLPSDRNNNRDKPERRRRFGPSFINLFRRWKLSSDLLRRVRVFICHLNCIHVSPQKILSIRAGTLLGNVTSSRGSKRHSSTTRGEGIFFTGFCS